MKKTENMNEYKRIYMKEWRRKNPERAKEILLRYWEKRIENEREKLQA